MKKVVCFLVFAVLISVNVNSQNVVDLGIKESNVASFNLNGRSISGDGLPKPQCVNKDIQEEGRVVVNITVAPNGNVIQAEIGRGTNIESIITRECALEAAERAKFNRIQSANNQSGTITYNYSLSTYERDIKTPKKQETTRKLSHAELLSKLEKEAGKERIEYWMNYRSWGAVELDKADVKEWDKASDIIEANYGTSLAWYSGEDEHDMECNDEVKEFHDFVVKKGYWTGEGELSEWHYGNKPKTTTHTQTTSAQSSNKSTTQTQSNSGLTEGTGGFGSFNISGRSIGSGGLPRPAYTEMEEGRIVINIVVDPDGNVISADIGQGTNIKSQSMLNSALAAAKRAKFNKIQSTNNQNGTITYNYKFT